MVSELKCKIFIAQKEFCFEKIFRPENTFFLSFFLEIYFVFVGVCKKIVKKDNSP